MKIKILATSDVHGYISPYRYSDKSLANQGLARLSGHIQRLRDENTLLIDNGDCLQGSPLNYYHSLFEKEALHPMAKAMNALGYDYYNLGNHDFNFGLTMLHHYMDALTPQCLTGNIYENQKPLGKSYTIHHFDDTHCIALIGVTTQHVPVWEQPKNIEGILFENAFDYVKKTVSWIQQNEKVDGIVVVYHGGYEKDLETGKETELLTGENLAWKMCNEIDGIDLLISGHQHRSFASICNNTHTTQTACNGQEMAYIEWDLDKHEIKTEILKADQPIDENLMQLIQTEENKTQQWLDEPLGRLKEGDLLVQDEFDARLHKHPVISFINQVQLSFASKAVLSAQALFNNAVGFNQEITMRDLVSTYVYPNTLMCLEMDGKTLKLFLEKCAEYFDVIDGKIGINPAYCSPKPQHYNYDMVDGLDYTIKVSNPIGNRIIKMIYQGKEVQEDDRLVMVMSNYRAGGGGDFDMLKACKVVQDIQKDMVECLAEYIRNHPVLEIKHENNIEVII